MRVLHVINCLAIGGAEVLIADLIPRLRERGIDACVAVMRRCPTRLEARIAGIPGALLYTGLTHPRSPRQIGRLAQLFQGFDIVHSHLYPTQLWVAIARTLSKHPVKLVTTEHTPNTNRTGKLWSYALDRWMYEQYDAIVCNSDATARAVQAQAPSAALRMKVIANGVDCSRFVDIAHTGSGKTPTAIFVARFEPPKDHITLLRAMKLVPRLQLQLVGDGTLRPEMEKFVAVSGLQDRVTFLGWRDDIPALLAAADIYVHTTRSDGFAISMAEAMAAGLPVVASDVPGLSSVLGDAGVLCRAEDAQALAAQLERLGASNELRADLGRRARERARKFSIEATVDAHIALYESLIGAGGAKSRDIVHRRSPANA